MISRRLVRIKTLQGLYAWQQADSMPIEKAAKSLQENFRLTYEVYLFLLEFPWQFSEFLLSERALEKSKFYPDKAYIRACGLLEKTQLAHDLWDKVVLRKRLYFTLNWNSQAEHFDAIFKALQEEDFVRDYLIFDEPGFEQQQLFMEQLYDWLMLSSENFHQMMEETYTGWNDDEDTLLKELKKTVSQSKKGQIRLSDADDPNGEDLQFGMRLFREVAENSQAYEDRVAGITDNWDPSRIAVLDLIAIKMALAEFLHFPLIPVKVTINEYLDIIKDYSTPSSGRFLNGVLDKMRKELEKAGEIQKSGRGLRDR